MTTQHEREAVAIILQAHYKGWPKCIWIKCVQGIGSSEAQAKKGVKSAFEGSGRPDLQEDHLKITVSKENSHYQDLFTIFNLFSELQSQTIKDASYMEKYTDFKITPHSLQKAANFHKIAKLHVTSFLESLTMKPMDVASSNFLRVHGATVHAEEQNYIPGEYKYIEDSLLPHLGLSLQSSTSLRDHQLQALACVFPPTRVPRVARSGVLEMPCGSGKTLTGIAIACKIQKPTLVLCNNSDAVNHWRSEFLRFSNISEHGITRATGDIKEKLFKNAGVFITTYQMLSGRGKSKHSQYHIETAKSRVWGCLLYDEVHHLPAARNSAIANILQAKCKIGLTGTYNREDKKISELDTLVGPCLYRTNLQFLREQQLVANIMMKQVLCEMSPDYMKTYNCVRGKSAHRVRSILSVLSPHKFHAVLSLITKHEAQGDKILVFVDNKFEIQEYSSRLNRSFISGDSDKQLRETLFNGFLNGNTINTLLITRTGDESLNLPIANVVIQTSFHHGANNQEMQRLGRILRTKGAPVERGTIEGVFYSLVSNGTREMVYAKKRRKLVISDGVDYIEEVAQRDPNVHFPTATEQAMLLEAVLAKYADSAYLDTVAPSDHAKKVEQELERLAAQKAKEAAENSEEEEEEEEEGDASSESESESGSEANDKKITQQTTTTTQTEQTQQTQQTQPTTAATATTESMGNKETENKDNKESEQQLAGKKRTEPEAPTAASATVHDNYRRGKVLPTAAKKQFQPNLPMRAKK